MKTDKLNQWIAALVLSSFVPGMCFADSPADAPKASCMNSVSASQKAHFEALTASMNAAAAGQLSSDQLDAIINRNDEEELNAVKLGVSIQESQQILTQKVADAQKRFFSAVQSYMQYAQIAANFSSLVKLMFVEKTKADNEREASYKDIMNAMRDLEDLGFQSNDLTPYRKALVIALESTDFDSGTKQIKDCIHLAYAAPVVVPLFIFAPELAQGFATRLGAQVLKSVPVAYKDSDGEGAKEFFCNLTRQTHCCPA